MAISPGSPTVHLNQEEKFMSVINVLKVVMTFEIPMDPTKIDDLTNAVMDMKSIEAAAEEKKATNIDMAWRVERKRVVQPAEPKPGKPTAGSVASS